MENNSTRSWWERIREGIPSLFAPPKTEDTLEVSPETRVLVARITERLIAHKSQAELTLEQQVEWQRLHQPLSTMFTKYNMTQAYRRLNPQDNEARLQFQSMLLGALATDAELREQFEAAMPVPVPHWLVSEDEQTEAEIATRAEAEPAMQISQPEPVEPEAYAEDSPPEAAELLPEALSPQAIESEVSTEEVQPEAVVPQPATEEEQAEAAEAEQTADTTPNEETDEPLGLKYLVRELRSDPEFYRVVFALRYNNPGLFTLAAKLADEPALSSQLEKFFVKTKLGTQLVNGEPGKET